MDYLSLLVVLPIMASIFLLILTSRLSAESRRKFDSSIRMASLGITLAMFTITTLMFFGEKTCGSGDILCISGFGIGDGNWSDIAFNNFEFSESYVWIEPLGINWSVGVDGLSFPMVWLTTLLLPITIIATWNEKAGATYFPLILMMGGALIGVFVALDMFMFYVFWELTLIPMFFLILKWGGKDRKYAAQKFFIYTFTASVVMLLGLFTMYFLMDTQTFSMVDMVTEANGANSSGVWLGLEVQKALFIMLMIGFLVKLPAAPFHTWLPDAHVQAPTGGSMLLAGVMLKMGAYGMFRLPISLFPHALEEFRFIIMLIGLSLPCLGSNRLSWTNQPQEDGCVFLCFTHGYHSPRYRKYATSWMGSSSLHDVRSRNHQPNALRSLWCIQAPLSQHGNWCNAWNGKTFPMACHEHDVWMDGISRSSSPCWIRC